MKVYIYLIVIIIVAAGIAFGISMKKHKDRNKAFTTAALTAVGIIIVWNIIKVIGFISAFIQLNF